MSKEFENEKQKIAQIIKQLRSERGLSQRELSKMTGINQADICKIERGIANPSLSTIARLMESLEANLNIDFIYKSDETEFIVESWGNVNNKIKELSKESAVMIRDIMKTDIKSIILYGSCARGENGEDSDVDIALITTCNRLDAKRYDDELADISTYMMTKYMEVVNFVSLPYEEYMAKKSWYPYFRNIDEEGIVIYARG